MNIPNSDSTHTSLAQLFSQPIRGMQVQAIEIPMIQRDYAQGRSTPQVQQIRQRFITSLYDALDNPRGIDLDFVFGDVVEKVQGAQKVPTLHPLDGQQRLSTLFLLHCYLAWHIPETQGIPQPWHAFSYATRPGARAFCQFLATYCPTNMAQPTVSEWLKDQAKYLPTWKHDPTIQGMLVMLDALHERYRASPQDKRRAHWERLTDPVHPAIRFHLLPIPGTSENNTLYVKMNSRGKPLTEFENFKAELEALMRANTAAISLQAQQDFSHSIDTVWADLFWLYRGKDHLIDEEYMRYLRFLTEVLAWKQGMHVDHQSPHDARELTRLAQALFSAQSAKAAQAGECLDWMVQALDVWLELGADGLRKPRPIQQFFEQLFTRTGTCATVPLLVFNFREFNEQTVGVDMFRACCNLYGTRPWRLAHTLLFYGVLQGLLHQVPQEDFQTRLRLLRNLIEASQDDIRAGERNNMPELLTDVETVMAGGPLEDIKAFNQIQVRNESEKHVFLTAYPLLQTTLHHLEDHELLRGGLTVFELNPAQSAHTFEHRATRFPTLFSQPYIDVTGALLTHKHEGRSVKRNAGYRLAYLGAPKNSVPWDNLFRARKGEVPHPSSASLMALLDHNEEDTLAAVMHSFTSAADTPKDWRYYMVKYPVMRRGNSGSHVIGPGAGYSMARLNGYFCDNRSNHYDSYLLALAEQAQLQLGQIGNDKWPRCFTGDGTGKRHLELKRSGIKIQCVNTGWEFSHIPEDAVQRQAFESVVQRHRGYQNLLYAVPQTDGIDTEDRIELGAQLLQELIAAGM